MQLQKYLQEQGIKRIDFAERLKATPSSVTRLCEDAAWASRDMMIRIREATAGAVTADDFLPPFEPAAAPAPGPGAGS